MKKRINIRPIFGLSVILSIRFVFILIAFTFSSLQARAEGEATLTQSVTYSGETITMRLTQEDLRGEHFELWVQNSAGGYDVVEPVTERSYMGTVDEYPDAISCGILGDDGTFRGAVVFDRGVTWYTANDAVVDTRGLTYATFSDYQYPGAPTIQAGQAGSTMYGFDVGIDADYDYFHDTGGGSIAQTFENIEYSVCLVRAMYMKDVLLQPFLAEIIIYVGQMNAPSDIKILSLRREPSLIFEKGVLAF